MRGGANCGIALAVALLVMAGAADAKATPGHAAAVILPQTGYRAGRTPWGDPDFRGTWPLQNISDAGIPLERPAEMGTRATLTDAEFALRLEAARRSDAQFSREIEHAGTAGLAQWLQASSLGRRSSLVVEPADGRLPPLTPHAQELYRQGRSTWQSGEIVDWITDLDPFERCITRGFPAVMLPQPYNNGIRVFQSPGLVVLQLETFGTRIIPLGRGQHWPAQVRAWHGNSRGHWEGETLVIETTNIVNGDSATSDVSARAAGPFPGRNHATQPVGPNAKVTEWLARTGPDTIAYRMTYADADVFTAPWTLALEWTRDDGYSIYEYACHEGNTVREMITSARAARHSQASGISRNDGNSGWLGTARRARRTAGGGLRRICGRSSGVVDPRPSLAV